jgi:hypothetical protein
MSNENRNNRNNRKFGATKITNDNAPTAKKNVTSDKVWTMSAEELDNIPHEVLAEIAQAEMKAAEKEFRVAEGTILLFAVIIGVTMPHLPFYQVLIGLSVTIIPYVRLVQTTISNRLFRSEYIYQVCPVLLGGLLFAYYTISMATQFLLEGAKNLPL